MKQKTILQYMSTVSDSFLVVAFAALLALPLAVGLLVEPIRDSVQNTAFNPPIVNTAANVNLTPAVLGVSDVATVTLQPSALNISVKYANTIDAKKLTVDGSSATSGEYSVNGTVKINGTYSLLTLTNNSDRTVKLIPSLDFLDSKSTSFVLTAGNVQFPFDKQTTNSYSLTLDPGASVSISLISSGKNLGGFKATVKVS